MNYKYIEKLVNDCKAGDKSAKENLVQEFKPYILNLCSRTFIHGYDFEDIQSECYRILFKCVSLYNPSKHRFVAYATNGIKNSIFDLIRKYNTRKIFEGSETLILSNQLENTLKSDCMSAEDIVCENSDYEEVRLAIKNLTLPEQNMINYLFFSINTPHSSKPTVKEYSKLNNLEYSCALKRRNVIFKKLRNFILKRENGGEYYGN